MRRAILLFASLFFSFAVQALDLTLEQKLSDFDQLNAQIESGYGPYQYKTKVLPQSPAALKQIYRARVAETKSNGEFYYLMVQYVAEFHDGHFGISVPTQHQASLDIATDLVEGKVLVASAGQKYPVQKGDEIVAVNGQPVEEVIKDLQRYMSSGYTRTEKRSAVWSLFVRKGTRVPTPSGDVVVSYRSEKTGEVKEFKTQWIQKGTALDEAFSRIAPQLAGHSKFDTLSTRSAWMSILDKPHMDASFMCSAETRIKIPDGAEIVTKTPFVSYIHTTPFGRVGYLRVPHYSWDKKEEEVFAQYQYVLAKFEKETVGLILDQDHNCGGSVELVDKFVGIFMDRPYPALQFEIRASKAMYLSFTKEAKDVPENTLPWAHMQDVIKSILDSWNQGLFLTPKIGLTGDLLVPNEVRYTKPIVMLIDEMSGSGGDAFPGLMKGYGRAKLFGHRTSGLGGFVEQTAPLNYSGMNIRMTKSLFYRPDGVPIENNGAVPDVDYEITKDDFMNGFQNYHAKALEVLKGMVP